MKTKGLAASFENVRILSSLWFLFKTFYAQLAPAGFGWPANHKDRILVGNDAIPHGDEFPQPTFEDALDQIYFRLLETDDECFHYTAIQ